MEESKNIVPFNGEKYSIWKLRVRGLLAKHRVLKIVDDEIPNDPNSKWREKAELAKGLIIENLSNSLLSYTQGNVWPKEIFANLDSVYLRESVSSKLAIRRKYASFQLQPNCTLREHFNLFDELISEYVASGAKIDEMDKIMTLLKSMTKNYDAVVTSIETSIPINKMTLELVKARLLDYETKINDEAKDTSGKCLQTIVIPNKIYKQRFNRKPNPYNKFQRNKRHAKSNIVCYYCGKTGHIKKACYKLKNKKKDSNEESVYSNKCANTTQRENRAYAFMADRGGETAYDGSVKFIVDSGASDHMVNDANILHNRRMLQNPIKVSVAKNSTYIEAKEIGDASLSSDGNKILLKDVLLCEEIPYNLLSVPRMQAAGFTVIFKLDEVQVMSGSTVIMYGKSSNAMPVVSCSRIKTALASMAKKNDFNMWHQRLGHIGKAKFYEIKHNRMFEDVDLIKSIVPNDSLCEGCVSGKQSQLKYNKEKNKDHIVRPLQIIHTDVCGPITPTSVDDKCYFVIFVDQFTHYCVTYLLKRKSDVYDMFKDFALKSECHFNLKVEHLYCDNGREYLSQAMKEFCVSKGITYHLTVPYTPQQNGVAERMIRTLTEKARAMLHGAKLEKSFWGEAVLTATFLINRSPSNALRKRCKTPYEMWHGRKPLLKHLRVFGSVVYRLNKLRSTKFEGKSLKGILVGYEINGYKIWCLEENKFVKARDVIVDEGCFMEPKVAGNSNALETDCTVEPKVADEFNRSEIDLEPKVASKNSRSEIDLEPKVADEFNRSEIDLEPKVAGKSSRSEIDLESKVADNDSRSEIDLEPKVVDNNLHNTYPFRKKRKLNIELDKSNIELRKSNRIKKQTKKNYYEGHMWEDNCLLYAHSEFDEIPKSYSEIGQRNDKDAWFEAIETELESHKFNNTWTLVRKPNDKNIIDNKWHFTIKHDQYGKPVRHKARLVARGFTQEYLVDYTETFAPVARITSFRFMVAFANQNNLLLHHMDVKTAFLNGDLQEEIFMEPPEHFKCKPGMVCKLNKSIYGLKQAARCWYQKFDFVLKKKGFVNSEVDKCIYVLDKNDMHQNIYIVLYVDDLVHPILPYVMLKIT